MSGAHGIQPISLGAFIDLLAARPADQSVQFDFGSFRPTGFDSYRGFYDHLALGYSEGAAGFHLVGSLLAAARECVGQSFEGYKGGMFRVGRQTPLWVANHGEAPSSCVIGVHGGRYETVVLTGYCEEWAGGTMRALQVLTQGLGFGNHHLTEPDGSPKEGVTMAEAKITVDIALELQETYERAVAMRDGWAALATSLVASGKVCPHPEEQRRRFEFPLPTREDLLRWRALLAAGEIRPRACSLAEALAWVDAQLATLTQDAA